MCAHIHATRVIPYPQGALTPLTASYPACQKLSKSPENHEPRNLIMRTEMTLSLITGELQRNCGDLLRACQSAGVSLVFVEQWRKDDRKVHDALAEAERVGTQGLLSAAIMRGVHGVDEDVYFKGAVVGTKKNYSDGLLQTLLKAKLPEFQAGEGGGTNVTVNIANVMPRADNYDQWLEMKRSTLALPAPAEQIATDAVFEDIPEQLPAWL